MEFFKGLSNMTGEDKPLTQVEVTTLEKLINSTKVNKKQLRFQWRRILVHV